MTAAESSPTRFRSSEAFARAVRLMPGGVSSPVRAYQAVGGGPVFIQSGKGAWVTDLDGREYVDYVGSYGPLILGHAADPVVAAVAEATARGLSFGMPTEAESTLAELIIQAVPSIERVRLVNSGTEAVMSAVRLARAATERPKIIKCSGCYHGHSDGLLVEAGSGATTLGTPSSPGVPASIVAHTLLAPYNDLQAVRDLMERNVGEIACMLVEPVAGNMGCVPPAAGYLQGLRDLCDEHDVLLLFDEVMSGFRVAHGGAQQRYGVNPDLTCLGKIVGGGLPCAAYGGGGGLMDQIAPAGPVYQAGTLSGNPLAMAAGIATLEALRRPGVYETLEQSSLRLAQGLEQAAREAGAGVRISRVGSMLSVFFSNKPVTDYQSAVGCRTDAFAAFFHAMLSRGVMLPPSQFETCFVSTAHDEQALQRTLTAAAPAFAAAAEV